VNQEEDPSAPGIVATATRSDNGDSLYVDVTTSAGKQCHSWTWAFLQDALSMQLSRVASCGLIPRRGLA
jgi:hypothetical protein